VTSFLENMESKAKSVNPMDNKSSGQGCTPNVEIKHNLHTYLVGFLEDLEKRSDRITCVVSK